MTYKNSDIWDKPTKNFIDATADVKQNQSNVTSGELKCGHTGIDWNNKGDCITCTRDKILGTNHPTTEDELLHKLRLNNG